MELLWKENDDIRAKLKNEKYKGVSSGGNKKTWR